MEYKYLSMDYPEKWYCFDMTDMGKHRRMQCENCGYEKIRYIHHMKNAITGEELDVGCICAGHMEGDPETARERERVLRNRANRRAQFPHLKKWKRSKKGNHKIKIGNYIYVVFFDGFNWRWIGFEQLNYFLIDRTGRKPQKVESTLSHESEKAAMLNLFDELYPSNPFEGGQE